MQSREPLLRIAHAKLPTLVRRRSESGAGEIRIVNPGVQRVALVDIDHRSVGSNRVRQTTAWRDGQQCPLHAILCQLRVCAFQQLLSDLEKARRELLHTYSWRVRSAGPSAP